MVSEKNELPTWEATREGREMSFCSDESKGKLKEQAQPWSTGEAGLLSVVTGDTGKRLTWNLN